MGVRVPERLDKRVIHPAVQPGEEDGDAREEHAATDDRQQRESAHAEDDQRGADVDARGAHRGDERPPAGLAETLGPVFDGREMMAVVVR